MFNLIPRGITEETPTPDVDSKFFAGPTCDNLVPTINIDGTITIPSFTVNLFDNATYDGDVLGYILERNTLNPPQGQSYIVAKYNGGEPDFFCITDVEEINESDVVPIVTVFKDGTKLHWIDWNGYACGLPNRLHQRFVKTRRFERESGLVLAQYDTLKFTLTEGKVWVGGNRITLPSFDSATDELELYHHTNSAWVATTVTAFNNSQYDTSTNLATLNNNKYNVNWIYRGIETIKHCALVLSKEEYTTEILAAAAAVPAVPQIISAHMILVGRIIIKKSATTGTLQSAFDISFSGTPTVVHNELNSIQGGLIGNYYHYSYFADVTAAEVATGGTTGVTVCYVQSTLTWYRWEAASGATRDGTSVLNTADAGTTRWVAFAGGASAKSHETLSLIQGGFTNNHSHYAYYATIAAAKAATGGTTGVTVCYVQEALTWYRWEASDTTTANDRGVLITGDGGNTRWRAIAGRWVSQQWNDYLIDLSVVGSGAAAPAITAIPGLSPLQTYGFSGTNVTPDELAGSIEMLHDYKEGTDVYFHVHWSKADAGAGNVKWQLQYAWGIDNAEWISLQNTFVTDAPPTALGPNSRPYTRFSEFPVIIGSTLKIGTQIRFRLFRDPIDAADTYTGLALLYNIGIHYESDSNGSVQKASKT